VSLAPVDVLVFGTAFRDPDEFLAAELLDDDERGEPGRRFDLARRLSLEELPDVGPHPMAGGPEGQAQGGRRLALAVPRIDLDAALEGPGPWRCSHGVYC